VITTLLACYLEYGYFTAVPPEPGKVAPFTVRSQGFFTFDQDKVLKPSALRHTVRVNEDYILSLSSPHAAVTGSVRRSSALHEKLNWVVGDDGLCTVGGTVVDHDYFVPVVRIGLVEQGLKGPHDAIPFVENWDDNGHKRQIAGCHQSIPGGEQSILRAVANIRLRRPNA